ncbi:MAG: FG-GAP repeat domain-containing protein, partial [Pirellula sp.]
MYRDFKFVFEYNVQDTYLSLPSSIPSCPMKRFLSFGIASYFLTSISAILAAPPKVEFETVRVGTFRSEACCVGDFNNDKKLDIMAGPYLYLGPTWKQVEIRKLAGEVDEKGIGYYHDFANLPMDVDGDGWLDVVGAFW